ncbi:hypothetical protein J1605_013630 [Eschrichtius robustus]|uniref:Uncharacterized protein n=1 Tax=Eschrichtius robustus TaxID=9764 RepID=A0AB34GEV0_ESCRO|nr:hypothetical protein J1605_013630 [Eschrichtius robustus]
MLALGSGCKYRLSSAERFDRTETIINQLLADSYQNPISEWQVMTIKLHLLHLQLSPTTATHPRVNTNLQAPAAPTKRGEQRGGGSSAHARCGRRGPAGCACALRRPDASASAPGYPVRVPWRDGAAVPDPVLLGQTPATATAAVEVLYFAESAEITGIRSETISVPQEIKALQLWNEIETRHPG